MTDPKPKKPADPAATHEDDPRPEPHWKHPEEVNKPTIDDDEDDDLFNDLPV